MGERDDVSACVSAAEALVIVRLASSSSKDSAKISEMLQEHLENVQQARDTLES